MQVICGPIKGAPTCGILFAIMNSISNSPTALPAPQRHSTFHDDADDVERLAVVARPKFTTFWRKLYYADEPQNIYMTCVG